MRQLILKILAAFGYELRKVRKSEDRKFKDPLECQKYLLSGSGQDEPVIFDVGANRGQTAIRYRSVFPGSRIYSFEPFPDSFKALKEVTSEDDLCFCVNAAVADQSGTRTFYVNCMDSTNSLLPRPKLDKRYYPKDAGEKTTTEVNTITLDDFIRENSIERVDILKMDIQGGELFALEGAKELLSKSFFPIIYTEVMFVPHYEGGALMYQIWSHLQEFGYSLYSVYNLYKARNGQLRQGDAIFISEKLRKEFIDQHPEEP